MNNAKRTTPSKGETDNSTINHKSLRRVRQLNYSRLLTNDPALTKPLPGWYIRRMKKRQAKTEKLNSPVQQTSNGKVLKPSSSKTRRDRRKMRRLMSHMKEVAVQAVMPIVTEFKQAMNSLVSLLSARGSRPQKKERAHQGLYEGYRKDNNIIERSEDHLSKGAGEQPKNNKKESQNRPKRVWAPKFVSGGILKDANEEHLNAEFETAKVVGETETPSKQTVESVSNPDQAKKLETGSAKIFEYKGTLEGKRDLVKMEVGGVGYIAAGEYIAKQAKMKAKATAASSLSGCTRDYVDNYCSNCGSSTLGHPCPYTKGVQFANPITYTQPIDYDVHNLTSRRVILVDRARIYKAVSSGIELTGEEWAELASCFGERVKTEVADALASLLGKPQFMSASVASIQMVRNEFHAKSWAMRHALSYEFEPARGDYNAEPLSGTKWVDREGHLVWPFKKPHCLCMHTRLGRNFSCPSGNQCRDELRKELAAYQKTFAFALQAIPHRYLAAGTASSTKAIKSGSVRRRTRSSNSGAGGGKDNINIYTSVNTFEELESMFDYRSDPEFDDDVDWDDPYSGSDTD